jgi:NADPH-dependent curcumin reductase CurA
MPKEIDWALNQEDIPRPEPGQLLVHALYLDVAPYMRGRISSRKNYTQGVKPGQIMIGGAVGQVVQSCSEHFAAGDVVVTDFAFGWQEYAVLSENAVRRVDLSLAPPPYWLDIFGINGLTAYFALFETAQIRAGDTVAISAAMGSVGQIAGQLARLAGCRTLGFTSSDAKVVLCQSMGYDIALNYRTESDLTGAIAQHCPNGVNVFIDNTAGAIHDAVMCNLATGSRVVIVGTASLAAHFEQADIGLRFLRQIMIARATVRGFLVTDYQPQYSVALERLGRWHAAGKIASRFDIAHGIEQMPAAFLRLLNSKNIGKQLVQIGE